MTIESEISKVKYTGNGETSIFAVPFKFLKNKNGSSQLSVYIGDNVSPLSENKDYTVNGAGEESGGEIIFAKAPAQDELIAIIRNVPATQEIRFIAGEDFPASEYEQSLDKQTMLIQSLQETVSRAIVLTPTSDQDPEKLLYDTLASVQEAMEASADAQTASKSAEAAAETALKTAENAVSEINTATKGALEDIEVERVKQVDLVEKAGSDQKNEIETLVSQKTTDFNDNFADKLQEIKDEGDVQIGLVEKTGKEQTDAAKAQATAAAKSATQALTAAESAAAAVDGFDAHAAEVQGNFDGNAAEKTAAFNNNVAEKQDLINQAGDTQVKAVNDAISGFDDNVATKTTAFNDNATAKTEAFNTNATEKQEAIDQAGQQAADNAALAQSWAVGTQEERPEGSAKHWAEAAAASSGIPAVSADTAYGSFSNDGTSAFWSQAGDCWFQLLTPYEDFYYMDGNMDRWTPGDTSTAGPKFLTEIKYRHFAKYKDGDTIDEKKTLPTNPEGVWKLPPMFEDFSSELSSNRIYILCYGRYDTSNSTDTGYFAVPLEILYKHIDEFVGYVPIRLSAAYALTLERNSEAFSVQAIVAIQHNNFGDTGASFAPKDGNYFNWLNTAFPTLFNSLKYYTQHFMIPKAAWAAMPSSKVTNLTFVDDQNYTAPADGYYNLTVRATAADQFLAVYKNEILCYEVRSVSNGTLLTVYLPVTKGDVFSVDSTAGGSIDRFVFIYANGSAN